MQLLLVPGPKVGIVQPQKTLVNENVDSIHCRTPKSVSQVSCQEQSSLGQLKWKAVVSKPVYSLSC